MKIADISKWQGNVDWDKARKELELVIFRASCGSSIDSKFLANVAACGVPFGVYHYVKAGTADESRAEARFFVECVRKAAHQPNFYIADIEYETQTETTTEAVCVAFLEELRSLGCKKIGLYINTRYKWAGKAIAMCDIMWVPRYGKNTGDIPGDPYLPKYPCDLWQYTSKGTLAGVKGDVDLNILYGDKPLEYFTEKEGETPMTYDPKKVIDIALAEVGYLEKETNAQLDDKTANAGDDNYTKYARDLDAIGFYNGRKQAVAWCDVFVDWCFVQAYGKEAALAITFQPTKASSNCGAGCKYSRQYYEKNGQLFDTPEPGDQVFFYSSDKSKISHTGLVYAVDTNYVYTSEGNTSSKSGVVANGGAVEKKKYKRSYNRLAGFGRPAYGQRVEPAPDLRLGDRLPLVKGDEGDDVAELQTVLKNLGYDLGAYGANKDGVDGDYGSKTVAAVKAYQSANGLTANGKYDEATHAVMSGATPAPAPAQPDPAQPTDGKKIVVIKCDDGKVNIRQGDSTDYPSITQVTDGTTFEHVATSPTGWYGIRHKKCIAWVSPKYSELTTA